MDHPLPGRKLCNVISKHRLQNSFRLPIEPCIEAASLGWLTTNSIQGIDRNLLFCVLDIVRYAGEGELVFALSHSNAILLTWPESVNRGFRRRC